MPSSPGALRLGPFFRRAFATMAGVTTSGFNGSGGCCAGSHDGCVSQDGASRKTSAKNVWHSDAEQSGGSDPRARPQISSASFLGLTAAIRWWRRVRRALVMSSVDSLRRAWILQAAHASFKELRSALALLRAALTISLIAPFSAWSGWRRLGGDGWAFGG